MKEIIKGIRYASLHCQGSNTNRLPYNKFFELKKNKLLKSGDFCVEEWFGLDFQNNDGGREKAGYKGSTGDCVTRSICNASGLPYEKVYGGVIEDADFVYYGDEDEPLGEYEISSSRGFFDGVWDEDTGLLLDQDSIELINKGSGIYFGELGDYTGDTDFAQVRYFNKPVNMTELLGFGDSIDREDNNPANPGSERYWKNIIPKDHNIYQRTGVDFDFPLPGEFCYVEAWNIIEINLCIDMYYYETQWELEGPGGEIIISKDDNMFINAYQCIKVTQTLSETGLYKINLFDEFGDGGIGGDVKIADTIITLISWGENDWGGTESYPFYISPDVVDIEDESGE